MSPKKKKMLSYLFFTSSGVQNIVMPFTQKGRVKVGSFKNPCQALLHSLPLSSLLAMMSRMNHIAKTSGAVRNWFSDTWEKHGQ